MQDRHEPYGMGQQDGVKNAEHVEHITSARTPGRKNAQGRIKHAERRIAP